MTFLTRLRDRWRGETRAARSADAFLSSIFGPNLAAGPVSPDAVVSNLAVAYRCITARAELSASVPLHLYRRTADGGRERASDHPLYRVLHDMANPNLSAFEAREWASRSLDYHGNALFHLERNGAGQVTAIHPVPWPNVGVERLDSGRLRYRVTGERGGTHVLLQDEALHVRGASKDGVIGVSPIALARGALGLAMAQSDTASALMANALRPSVLFSFPEKLGTEARNALRDNITTGFAGATNAGKALVLDAGAKAEKLTLSPEDAELLASRKLANEDVARIFGMPPTTVGITDKATYSNTEQEARALVQNALGPLAARIEAAIARCCLTEAGRRTYYAEHDLSGLLRGDVKSRFEAYRLGREIGLYSANDIARLENLPPVEGGDARYVPANWMALGKTAPDKGVPSL